MYRSSYIALLVTTVDTHAGPIAGTNNTRGAEFPASTIHSGPAPAVTRCTVFPLSATTWLGAQEQRAVSRRRNSSQIDPQNVAFGVSYHHPAAEFEVISSPTGALIDPAAGERTAEVGVVFTCEIAVITPLRAVGNHQFIAAGHKLQSPKSLCMRSATCAPAPCPTNATTETPPEPEPAAKRPSPYRSPRRRELQGKKIH